VFGRRRSLTAGQTKRLFHDTARACSGMLVLQQLLQQTTSAHTVALQTRTSSLFLPRSIRVLAKVPKRSRQFSQISNKNAAQHHSFLLQQSTKPRFHVDTTTRLSSLRSQFHPPGALYAGFRFQSLIRVPSDSLLIG
jgi:hypothetical protein